QAPLAERAILGTVGAVHPVGVVVRRRIVATRRGLAVQALRFEILGPRLSVPAGATRAGAPLEQHLQVRANVGVALLRFGRQRRNPAIGRINDLRRARTGVPYGLKDCVVRTGNVSLAAYIFPAIASQ